VPAACRALRDKLIADAIADPQSPLHDFAPDKISAADGWLVSAGSSTARESIAAVVGRSADTLEGRADAKPGAEKSQYAMHSFGAVFVEVAVDPDVAQIRVPRIVATYDVGRLLNAKTALSQLQGGLVWGVSFALFEESMLDQRIGPLRQCQSRRISHPRERGHQKLAVNFVEQPDLRFNPLGVRGIGEIGITGVAGALCNAVYHATGKRIRRVPITLDLLLT
jgi:xanthine dehydrogenase YagR molybdenum-binding subunit